MSRAGRKGLGYRLRLALCPSRVKRYYRPGVSARFDPSCDLVSSFVQRGPTRDKSRNCGNRSCWDPSKSRIEWAEAFRDLALEPDGPLTAHKLPYSSRLHDHSHASQTLDWLNQMKSNGEIFGVRPPQLWDVLV